MPKYTNDIENQIHAVRDILKRKLINNELYGYEEQKKQVYNIMKRTIVYGESDSLIIVSPRGCGKSTLISACLKDLAAEFQSSQDYIIIQLNGFVHTDDSLALKDIIQQLHVDELDGDRITGSFSDNLLFVLQSLNSGNRNSSKAILFILDEFHLFCSHRNQTLLYNLFDVAQSAQAPICVIGLTTRIDISEMLEKRVKSRFSHRQVMLYPSNDIGDRLLIIIELLSLSEESNKIFKPLDKQFNLFWNDRIHKIFQCRDIIINVKRLLDLDPSIRKLKSWLFLVVSKITSKKPYITEEIVYEVIGNNSDARVDILKDLSVLEFCLVVAMSHHNEIYDGEPFNFEMIFKRYTKFASQNYAAQITQRPILFKGFERLAELEVILPISGSNKAFKKEYQLYKLCVTKSQVKEAADGYSSLPTDVAQWASSSVLSLE